MQKVGDAKWTADRIVEMKANIAWHQRQIEELQNKIAMLETLNINHVMPSASAS
jgi:hypothetical protein